MTSMQPCECPNTSDNVTTITAPINNTNSAQTTVAFFIFFLVDLQETKIAARNFITLKKFTRRSQNAIHSMEKETLF